MACRNTEKAPHPVLIGLSQVLSDLAFDLNACFASFGWLWQVVIDLPVSSSPRFQPPHWSLAFSPAPSAYVAVSQWSGAVHLFHTSAQAAAEAENQPACIIPPPTQGKDTHPFSWVHKGRAFHFGRSTEPIA